MCVQDTVLVTQTFWIIPLYCTHNKVLMNDMTLGIHGMLSAGEVRRGEHTSFQTPLAPNSGTWAAAWQLLERRWSYQIYLTIRKAEVFSCFPAPFQGSVSHKVKLCFSQGYTYIGFVSQTFLKSWEHIFGLVFWLNTSWPPGL